jgi:hypothetical protein
MKTYRRYLTAGLALAGAALFVFPQAAFACEKCFGAAGDSPTVQGISLAMLALLSITGVVWGGIMVFFNNMDRRAKLLESGELVVTSDGGVVESALVDEEACGRMLDVLLDKISREGYASLSRRERALLHEMTAGGGS